MGIHLRKFHTLVIAALTLMPGCAWVPTIVNNGVDAGTVLAEHRSVYSAAEDYAIKQEITGRLLDENLLLNVSTDVYKGRVMLTGAAKTATVRKRAEELARLTPTVRDVFNDIQITDDCGMRSLALGLIVETLLKAKLFTADSVRSINYRWRAVNGVVYILGAAGGPDELGRVVGIARGTDGVRKVVIHVLSQGVDQPDVMYAQGTDGLFTVTPASTEKTAALRAHVVSVQDGDTMTVLVGRKRERVRLIGSETSDVQVSPNGKRAREFLSRLVRGKTVRLETDTTRRDRSKRLLAHVYVGAVSVNLELIRQGQALADNRPPNVKHAAEYRNAQEEAQEAGRGIWAGKPSPFMPAPCLTASSNTSGC